MLDVSTRRLTKMEVVVLSVANEHQTSDDVDERCRGISLRSTHSFLSSLLFLVDRTHALAMASCQSIGSCTIVPVRERLVLELDRVGASRRIRQRFACARHQLHRRWPVGPDISPVVCRKYPSLLPKRVSRFNASCRGAE